MAKKEKIKIPKLLCIIGWITLLLSVLAGVICQFTYGLNKMNNITSGIYSIILGISCLLTLPQHIINVMEAEKFSLQNGKALVMSIVGPLLIPVGIFLIVKGFIVY